MLTDISLNGGDVPIITAETSEIPALRKERISAGGVEEKQVPATSVQDNSILVSLKKSISGKTRTRFLCFVCRCSCVASLRFRVFPLFNFSLSLSPGGQMS